MTDEAKIDEAMATMAAFSHGIANTLERGIAEGHLLPQIAIRSALGAAMAVAENHLTADEAVELFGRQLASLAAAVRDGASMHFDS